MRPAPDKKPLIGILFERLRKSRTLDDIILATGEEVSNQPILSYCQTLGIKTFSGSEDDVLSRFIGAAEGAPHDLIVRITGDCPLIDPDVVDRCVDLMGELNVQYVSNCLPPTFPDGLDVEVFTRGALEWAHHNATKLSDREHVTPAIRRRCEKGIWQFRNLSFSMDASKLRLTVDEPSDFELFQVLVREHNAELLSCEDLVNIMLSRADLLNLNAHIGRNEGYQKSLTDDLTAVPQGKHIQQRGTQS